MKKIITTTSFALLALVATAQNGNGNGNGNSSSQSVKVKVNNSIKITFTGNSGNDVTLPFTTVNHYANGVESDAKELKVKSNKNFSVMVKANAADFSYIGNTNPAPTMPVSGVLALKVTDNSTDGAIVAPFSSNSYATLTSSNQDLISAARRGGNQRFSVKYKATPGFAYPAGTYLVDIIYTATQD